VSSEFDLSELFALAIPACVESCHPVADNWVTKPVTTRGASGWPLVAATRARGSPSLPLLRSALAAFEHVEAVWHRPYPGSISAPCRCVSVRSITVEKHELSKVEFEIIDKALKALQQSNLDPVTADKVADLRNMFQDAYTGGLEIYQEAA
jgi:hypothetical protein